MKEIDYITRGETSYVVRVKGMGYYAHEQCGEVTAYVDMPEKAKWFKDKNNARVLVDMLMSQESVVRCDIYEIEYEFVRLLAIKNRESFTKGE